MTWLVGIDLGTSHCAIACARPDSEQIENVSIEQWLPGKRLGGQALLPSALYYPLEGELPGAALGFIAGQYALERHGNVLGRTVLSSKSWLCHAAVDRREALLPEAHVRAEGVPGISPLQATEHLLQHLAQAFERSGRGRLRDQALVLVTIPASFDQTARRLTLEAAQGVGLSVRLLEEPQAAFLDALSGPQGDELRARLRQAKRLNVLVCDLGGGTLDLTLIRATVGESPEEAPRFERTAVGRHLLLGGDNMDWSVAGLLAAKASKGASLRPEDWAVWLPVARRAKEALLSGDAPERYAARRVAAGSNLFAGIEVVNLEREEVVARVLDGFFPIVPLDARVAGRVSGLSRTGLPYERDPGVTRHLASFLHRHCEGAAPDVLLLNGGVFLSPAIVQRLTRCFEAWSMRPVLVLRTPDASLSVSRGAVRHALALRGRGPLIEGGSARSFYVGVAAQGSKRGMAVCVVPKGAREAEAHLVGGRPFELTLGETTRFDFFSSDERQDAPGALVSISEAELIRLPSVRVQLPPSKADKAERVRVYLQGELTAVGTVELSCVEAGELSNPRRFELHFDVRAERTTQSPAVRDMARSPGEPPGRVSSLPATGGSVVEAAAATTDQRMLNDVRNFVDEVFGRRKSDAPRAAKDLLRTLERRCGEKRTWPLWLLRALADQLISCKATRFRSEDHERVFWMLTGFGMRPGFGCDGDARRMKALVPALQEGLRYREPERGWQQYWIAWRRVAGGLSAPVQLQLRDQVDGALDPSGRRRLRKGFRPKGQAELLALVAQLERVPAARRRELGEWILERTYSDRDPRLWSHLAYVGARVPTYATANDCLDARLVEPWLDELLREKWADVPTAAQAAFRLARCTGDPRRDVGVDLRERVREALLGSQAPAEWAQAVSTVVPFTEEERRELLGEDLPQGLRLVDSEEQPR